MAMVFVRRKEASRKTAEEWSAEEAEACNSRERERRGWVREGTW